MPKVAIVSKIYFLHFNRMHRARAYTILSNISIFSLFMLSNSKQKYDAFDSSNAIAYTKFIYGSLYHIFDAECSPQLVR